ncbi:MAG: Ppx/GppA family phosphatase [Nitrospinae bacterium]|nr:Ppx/GppA family phosphatase [Nitrospinota bacterium]
MKRVAAIDLGTNTVRMLVAEQAPEGFSTVYSNQIITRLGEGLTATGLLSEKAMKRTVEGIAHLVSQAQSHRPFDLYIAATSAARDAGNTAVFARMVKEAVGADLMVIPWEEEARLSLLGASLVTGGRLDKFVLFDVGGGSTEYILAASGAPAGKCGTDLGVVRLTEKYITKHPVADYEYGRLLAEVEAKVDTAFDTLGAGGGETVVGTAGTVTSIAAMALGLTEYDQGRINNSVVTSADVEALRRKIFAMTIAERGHLAFLKDGREDLIVPGFAIVQATMNRFGADKLVVSDYGLREGFVMELLYSPGAWV